MSDPAGQPLQGVAVLGLTETGPMERGAPLNWQHWPAIAAVLLAVLFGCYAMRGAWETSPAYPDAPRHAMNGALLLDMLREWGWSHPVQFASRYYAHLPAISIPYHPPLFPLFEAAVFSVFGVSTVSARLAVAICAGASLLLLFAFARAASAGPVAALSATAVFLFTPFSDSVATDVLLEFPALVFTAGSVLLMERAFARGEPYRGLALAGLLAAAAIWTKQTTVFLLAIPGCVVVLRQDWKLLRNWRFAAFQIVSLSGFASIMLVARAAGAAGNAGWQYKPLLDRVQHHATFYGDAAVALLGWPVTLLCALVLAYVLIFRFTRGWFRNLDVSLAWIAVSLALLLVLPPRDARYLFYTLPPLSVVVFAAIDASASKLEVPYSLRAAAFVAAAIAALLLWRAPVSQVDGFDDAAQFTATRSPRRLMVLSRAYNGAFVFEYRARQSARTTFVLRGHAMPAAQYQASEFLQLLHELGVEYVVSHDSVAPEPWEGVQSIKDTRLIREAAFQTRITGQPPGVIYVFRFTDPSKHPRSVFAAPSSIGTGTRVSVLE